MKIKVFLFHSLMKIIYNNLLIYNPIKRLKKHMMLVKFQLDVFLY